MRPSTKASASLCALALLLAGGCEIGQPVIDRAPIVVPPDPPVRRCLQPSKLCNAVLPEPTSTVRSRALTASTCEGAIQASCDVPPLEGSWRNADVIVEADEPREVVIAGVDVFNVRIRLDGPVTLVLRELTQLTNLELATSSPEAAVVFDDLVGTQVTIGDESAPFAGHVAARHSRLDRLSTVAASFEIDSAMFTESFIAADFMNSGDGLFRNVVLDLGDALFAPSEIEQAEIVRCRTLSFFGGKVTTTLVPPCESDEPTRIFNVVVSASIVDGTILGEGGTLHATQLGRHHPSDYLLWSVAVVESMFCDQAVRVRSTDNIRCSHCTEQALGEPEDDACNLHPPAEDRRTTKDNLCEALNLRSECAPVPDHERPISHYPF